MSNTNQEKETEIPVKDNNLHFKHLPAYARFLLEQHLSAFSLALLRISREEDVPLLRYFASMPEEALIALSRQGTEDLLTYFSQNRVREFIDKSIQSWTENQLPQIQSNEVVVEDISKISFARRKAFREFLPLHTTDVFAFMQIMEEVDKFTITLEEICYKELFKMKQQKINEHHHFIDKINHQLQEAQEIAGMGSFEWDLVGQDSVFSPQLLKIFDLEGRTNLMSFLDHVHPSDRKKVKEAIEKAIKEDGLYESEYRYGTGEREKVIWSRGMVSFQDGQPQKMRGTVMDITQRHYMLQRLERSEELHKQAQALTHIGNWSWYIYEDKINWSDELYRIYGLAPQSEPITFERFLSLVHPADREKRQQEIQHALRTHHAEDYTMRIVLDDGTMKILQGRGEVLVDEDNKPYKLVGTCQDVTLEKNAELELQQQRNQLARKNIELERSNQELMAFNYIASHDLKEPVRKINIFSNLIIERSQDVLPENVKNYVERICAAANHMQKLIDALYTFSRTASTDQTLEYTDVNTLLEEVKNSLQEDIAEKKAVITTSPLPVLHVIPFQFRQLLENILCNALKYSRPGVRPEISISAALVSGSAFVQEGAEAESNYHAIAVRDNGIGFDQKYAHKIFDLFQRLHSKNEYSGTGIGLAICKKIAQHHHGFITACGEPDQGAVFTVYIPG